jgi:Htaa
MRSASRIAAALALTVALAVPATAGAAGPTGNTTLVLSKAKAKLLDQRGISFGGVGGADTAGRETRLQIDGGAIDTAGARFNHAGALRLLAGSGSNRRVVRLGAPQLELTPQRSVLSAKLDGKRRIVFDLGELKPGALAIDPQKGSLQLHGARLAWNRSIARAIGKRLAARLPRGVLGTLKASAATLKSEAEEQGPLGNEPPLLARPASAIDVSSATLTWHVRDSWIRYSNSEVAPQAIEGASPGAAIPGGSHPCPDQPVEGAPTLVYSFSFPFASGWYDPPTGTTALYESGGIRFSYPSRGIDMTMRNPEIEINGAASRAILRLRSGAGQDPRVAFLNLAASASPVENPAGTFTYAAPVRGALSPEGQAGFGSFGSIYSPPNNGFGCFSISFTTS